MDTFPVFWEFDAPFVVFGSTPTLFDAPGPNSPRAHDLWTAESWLAVCADTLRTRQVAPVCGFRWGYDLTAAPPAPFSPSVLDAGEWDCAATTLESSFHPWTFLPMTERSGRG